MTRSLLDLSAMTQLAIYEHALGHDSQGVNVDVFTNLRLTCRKIKRDIDHEAIKMFLKHITALPDMKKLSNATVTRPTSIKDMHTLHITLGIEHAQDHEKYPTPLSWIKNIIDMLPRSVRKITLHVQPNDAYISPDDRPSWEGLMRHYEEISLLLLDGTYDGPVRDLEVNWPRMPGWDETHRYGTTLWPSLEGSSSRVDILADGVRVKIHAQILGGEAVVLMLFGSQEQSPSKSVE
jgi:hypothetical protein